MVNLKACLRKLNKSKISLKVTLVAIIFVTLSSFVASNSAYSNKQESSIDLVIEPQVPHVGDTIILKIKKEKNDKNVPKVFFDKSKLPVFVLNESYYRTLIPLSANTKPKVFPIEIYFKGKGKKIDLDVKDTKYPVEDLTLTKEVAALRASKIERQLVGKAINSLTSKKLWTGRFSLPSQKPRSTVYGVKRRINGNFDPDYFHKGLDFAAQEGSNITAPEKGKVVLAGLVSMGFVVNGNCIFLDHGHGVVSGYLHLSKVLVKDGDIINKGQVIGKVGSTGIASGPHLHWGLYVLGKTVDPFQWISMTID